MSKQQSQDTAADALTHSTRAKLVWYVGRMPRKTRKSISSIIRDTWAQLPADAGKEQLAQELKGYLDRYAAGSDRLPWHIVIGFDFYYNISFKRGWAGVVELTDEKEKFRILMYKSAPFDLSAALPNTSILSSKESDSESNGSTPATATTTTSTSTSTSTSSSSGTQAETDTIADSTEDSTAVTTENSSMQLTATKSMLRKINLNTQRKTIPEWGEQVVRLVAAARTHNSTDLLEQATFIKDRLGKTNTFYQTLTDNHFPVTAVQRNKTLKERAIKHLPPPGYHVIIGKNLVHQVDAIEGTLAECKVGELRYLVFMHSTSPVEVGFTMGNLKKHPRAVLKFIAFCALMLFVLYFTNSRSAT